MQPQEGRSSWSVPTVATTAATSPSVPSGLSVISVSRGSVTLTWRPPAASGGAGVSGYEVQLQAVTRAAVEVLGRDWLIIYDGPSTATTFSALTAGCSYMARVAARNEAGVSGHSIALQFTTDADAPGAPPLPEAEVEATVSRCSDAHLLSSIAGGLAVPLQTLQHLKAGSAAGSASSMWPAHSHPHAHWHPLPPSHRSRCCSSGRPPRTTAARP